MIKSHPIVVSITLISLIWITYFISLFTPIDNYGLIPWTYQGLIGIVSMPFLHVNFIHLLGNTISLSTLLIIAIIFHNQKVVYVVPMIIILGGTILWFVGREANHIGASALIYGLALFLIFEGFLNKKPIEILASLIVIFFFGSSLAFGILPSHVVSWEGHLSGAVAGFFAALIKD